MALSSESGGSNTGDDENLTNSSVQPCRSAVQSTQGLLMY